MSDQESGHLVVCPTPIGNLEDVTLRVLSALRSADLVACEDTRRTRKLLTHFGIKNKLVSYHEHNENQRTEEFAALLEQGKSIAVVTDAGTPGIADPGFRIVERARAIGAKAVPIPGAVAFVNALIASGLPADSVFFGGFLPSKKSERRRRLQEIRSIPATLCFYETPHRINKSLADCLEVLGNRRAAVARELTKLHEEIVCGNLEELKKRFSEKQTKGEIVLVIEREQAAHIQTEITASKTLAERVAEIEAEADRKTALKQAAREFGLSKSEAYKILLREKDGK